MAKTVRTIGTVLDDLNEQTKVATKAIRENDLTALNAADDKLKELEKEYDAFALQTLYAELNAAEDPILEAIKKFTYATKRHRPVKTDGVVMSYEIIDVIRRIDLLAFCKQVDGADTSWQYDVQKLNKSLALRTANELKLPDAKINAIKTTFAMHKSIVGDRVEIPTSTAKIVKMLQAIVDKIIFSGEGEVNEYKVTSHDVNHLLMTYTQRDSKNALAVRVAKHKALTAEIATVCHKIVTGSTYDVIYAQLKERS